MAGNDPFVAEYNLRDATKTGILWNDITFGVQEFRNSSGLILTGATTPIIVNSNSANCVRWAANVANAVTFTVDVPGDYNEVADKARLQLKLFKSTAGNAAILMGLDVVIVRAGSAVPGISTSITSPPAISDATTPSIWDCSVSGLGLKGKDSVTFTITPAAHDTCVIDLFGGRFRYIGGTSLYNETDRYATS